MAKIKENEYHRFYKTYIDKADTSKSVVENLQESFEDALTFFKDIPEEKHLYRYAEDKWSIKELLEHIIDAERIFAYRALRIARNDKTDLSGFEENSYVENANSDSRDYQELLEEFSYVRKSTVFLFKNFSKQVMLQVGTIDGNEITVRAIGYVNSGHLLHHINIIKERYL
ncbi:MAG TPA: damage-inducible protein DinB [Flavobacteriaceae bacterium]|jgi:hypothetical protein|nr:damage-inducible protein DinB [Flavobacteriaceae bacterium]